MPSLALCIAALAVSIAIVQALPVPGPDPCATVAGKPFVTPIDALTCQRSFPFNETIRQNVLSNVARVFDFYTFEDFYLQSPPPFQDSTVNIRSQLARINSTNYATDWDFNKDLFDFTTQLNDGHTRWFPNCYLTYENILPAPLVSLAPSPHTLSQSSVYIAPDSAELLALFGPVFLAHLDAISFNSTRLAGARVLSIEGQDPYVFVDQIASTISGDALDHAVRVNSVFSSYRIVRASFSQRFGDFAARIFLGQDSVTATVLVDGSTAPETVQIPFVALFTGNDFTDQASYWANNCAATPRTNGVDLKTTAPLPPLTNGQSDANFRSQPIAGIADRSRQNAVDLPKEFLPNLTSIPGSGVSIKSFVLDESTGVMFIGSFEGNFTQFQLDIASAIDSFKQKGLTKLLIDTTNNPGGFTCLGIFLHQVLAGSSFGYAGFETTIRASPLAQKIVAANIRLGLASDITLYAPDNWRFLNGTQRPPTSDYVFPSIPFLVNGIDDPTSQRLHDTCELAFEAPIPETPPFDFGNIAIINNGQCASTCAMFASVMSERHGVKIAVFGGPPTGEIEFKETAGGQVLDWPDLDTEIKTADLKDDPLAPPDLLVNGNFRHNWRTAWSFTDENTPIEYLSEPAKFRFAYTTDTYNNPQKVWEFAAAALLA